MRHHTWVLANQTDAFKALQVNLKRPRALLEMFDAGSLKPTPGARRSRGKPGWQENELLRAAVIVGIGGLDAYLSDVAAEVLIAQLEHASNPNSDARNVLRRVMNEVDTLALELALLTDPAERRHVAQTAIGDHIANRVSNHGAKGVAATLGRMGQTMDWSELNKRVPPSLLVSGVKPTAPAVLDEWTERRHKLVHQSKALRIKNDQARGLVDFVEVIARAVDAVAADAK